MIACCAVATGVSNGLRCLGDIVSVEPLIPKLEVDRSCERTSASLDDETCQATKRPY